MYSAGTYSRVTQVHVYNVVVTKLPLAKKIQVERASSCSAGRQGELVDRSGFIDYSTTPVSTLIGSYVTSKPYYAVD